jgi:hypothetical protein
MPGPFTVVTFQDADGDDFPITLVGHYQTVGDAIADANGVLTRGIWEGTIRPRQPITLKGVSPDAPVQEVQPGGSHS